MKHFRVIKLLPKDFLPKANAGRIKSDILFIMDGLNKPESLHCCVVGISPQTSIDENSK